MCRRIRPCHARRRGRPALLEQPFGLRLACWRHGVFRGRGRELRSAHCRRPARMAGAPGPTQLKEPHMRYIIALYEIDRAYVGTEKEKGRAGGRAGRCKYGEI